MYFSLAYVSENGLWSWMRNIKRDAFRTSFKISLFEVFFNIKIQIQIYFYI